MTLLDYLQRKYGKEKPSIMTASEADAFGVPYPLQRGWLEIYGHKELGQNVIDGLVSKLKRKAANKPKKNGTGFYYERGAQILEGHVKQTRFPEGDVALAIKAAAEQPNPCVSRFITSDAVWHEIMKQHGSMLSVVSTFTGIGKKYVAYGIKGAELPLLMFCESWNADTDPERKAILVEYWLYISVPAK